MSNLYPHALRAAQLCEQGDDFEEARAVRALVEAHKAVVVQRDQLLTEAHKAAGLALERAKNAIDNQIVKGALPEPAHSERNGLVMGFNTVTVMWAEEKGKTQPAIANAEGDA